MTVFTDENFEQEVLKSETLVLVDFYADWCGPCKMMAPVVAALASEYAGKVKVGKIDVDQNGETAMNYRVMSIPTLVLFKDGKAIDRIEGAVPQAMVKQKIDRAL